MSRPGSVRLAEEANPDRQFPYEGSALVWHQFSGGKSQTFFDQERIGEAPGHREAVFIAAINGAAMILKIPFDGEFCHADAYKITYRRDGEHYSKSFYPWVVDVEYVFPEISPCISLGLDFPRELNGDELSRTISMDMKPIF